MEAAGESNPQAPEAGRPDRHEQRRHGLLSASEVLKACLNELLSRKSLDPHSLIIGMLLMPVALAGPALQPAHAEGARQRHRQIEQGDHVVGLKRSERPRVQQAP